MFRKLFAKRALKKAGRFALKREGKILAISFATIGAHLLLNRLAETYPKFSFLKQKSSSES